MKKALYMTLLLAAACLLGGLIGGAAKGYWSFLGTKIGFEFEPGNFLRTDFFSLTFGISLSLNLAQIALMLDAEFDSYYTGYYDDYLAGNAKVAKITGNGEYTVGVTTDSELFREYWQASTPKGFHNIEIKASGIEGAEDSVLTVKSIKINGKEQEIKQQPVSIYNYEDSIDVELFYEGYEEDAVLDVSSIDEWTDFEVTFELSGLPE